MEQKIDDLNPEDISRLKAQRKWVREHYTPESQNKYETLARKYLEEQICDNEMKILFWDRDLIIETCERKGLPDPIQRDIEKYLEYGVDSNDS